MASARIYTPTTGDGDVFGATELRATIWYTAFLDRVGDDPTGPVRAVLPPDSPHPDQGRFAGLISRLYVTHVTANPLIWYVEVVFDYPDRLSFAGWRVLINSGEETVRLYRDLDGRTIGPHAYLPVETPETPTAGMYFTRTVDGTVWLKLPEDQARQKVGLDVLRPVSSVTLVKTLRRMTAQCQRAVQERLHHANDNKFLAWNRGEMLFRGLVINEEQGQPDEGQGQRLPLVYPTELQFGIKLPTDDEPQGWPTARMLDEYLDAKGNTSLVYRHSEAGDELVAETYRRYPQTNFDDIIALLDGSKGPPRTRPRSTP